MPKWPTLKARLDNALTSEEEALRQLKLVLPLTELAEKKLQKYDRKKLKHH